METVITLVSFLLLIVFIVLVIYMFSYAFYGIFLAPVVFQLNLYKGVTKEQKEILEKKFPYYARLSAKYKMEFQKRLNYFLEKKEFVAKNMELTEEMKTLVGACAVQLTLGFQPLRFPHFPKILLFPGKFQTKQSKKLRKGEVNSIGLIVLSWEDFIYDYRISTDGINLGLHEMAHALKVEDAVSEDDYSFLDPHALEHFYEVSEEEYLKIRKGKRSFIRSYAGTDREEFFAVCVEQFFEQAPDFREHLPEIYKALVKLLQQDPAAKTIRIH